MILGEGPPALVAFPEDGLSDLPSLLALPLHHYRTETSPVLRLWHACDAVELMLRFTVMLGVAQFAAEGPLPVDLRVKLQQPIEEPTLGKWKAMAIELVKKVPKHGEFCPALPALIEDIVVPLLDGVGVVRTPEGSLLTLRNQLAHGGGMTQAVASRLLVAWQSRLQAFAVALAPLVEVRLVVRSSPGQLGVMAGPSPKPWPWLTSSPAIRERIEALLPRGDEVVAVCGDRCLQVWPLCAFGRPVPADADGPSAREPTLQVYARRGDVRLQFTAIGSEEAAVSHSDDLALSRFLDLFRVDAPSAFGAKARAFAVPSFEAEVQKEGAKLVGRTKELDTVRQALAETEAGVLWLAGAAGSGKSCLMARVATELIEASPKDVLILPYRFKAGDGRCTRENFLRFALDRLPRPEGEEQEEKKEASSRTLLHALGERLAAMDSKRALFVLDGLDEIAEHDPTFASEVIITTAEKSGTWLCAGRPEDGLPEAFANAETIFPEGLPQMAEADVRTMLLDRIGSRRFTLLKGDHDKGDRVFNPFIARVVDAARGLPLYVEFLIRDILGNRFRGLDAGEKLPPSLEAYFEELLLTCGIGVIEGFKPHLVATLAVAREPLSPTVLSEILVHGGVLPDDKHALPLVLRALSAVGSMVKRAQTPTGEDGFTLYHHALRQHLETTPNTKGLLFLARNRLCSLAVEPLASRVLARYLRRWGVTHLLEVDRPDEAVGLLTNFAGLMTRLQMLGDPGGVASFEADWLAVVAATTVIGDAAVWREFLRGCVHILRRGNEHWPSYKILLQLAVEHADDSPVTKQAEKWLAQEHCDWLWLRNARRVPSAGTNPCSAILEGHTNSVKGTMLLPEDRVLSWSYDHTLRLWDTTSGTCRAVLEGHTGFVSGAMMLPNAGVLSWSYDHTLRLWDTTSGACRAVLEGHTGSVSGAMMLPNAGVLSWSDDHTLRVWDATSGACRAVLEGHTSDPQQQAFWPLRGGVNGALLLPDGRLLSWSVDHTLRVWDATSGECRAVLEGHTSEVRGALVMLDGYVLSWSMDQTLRIWDATTGTCRATLEGHKSFVSGALLLPDGCVVSWSSSLFEDDHNLWVWDTATRECRAVLSGHTGDVTGAMLLPDGGVLSWSNDQTLRIWDITSGTCRAVLEGHTNSVYGAMLLPDNGVLSWSDDQTLRIWDGKSGGPRAVLKGHSDIVIGAMLLPEGGLLSWSRDDTLRVWKEAAGASHTVLEGHSHFVTGAMLLPEGGVLSWSHDQTLRIWDATSGICRLVLEGHTSSVGGAMLLRDGGVLSWSHDKTLRIWDATSGACRAVLEGHTNWVSDPLLLPDGGVLSFSHHGDNTLRIWNTTSGTCRAILEGHSGSIFGEMLLPDDGVLSWSADQTLRIWDATSGACLAILEGHSDSVKGALLLPDGGVLSWSFDTTLRVWDARTGKCRTVLEGHSSSVSGAMLLLDNGVLSWSIDYTLRLWDTTSGQCRMVLEGHTGFVNGALLLPDDVVLSWSDDTTLRVWDARTGKCRTVLEGHTGKVTGAMLLANGSALSWSSDNTLGHDDNTLRVWDVMTGVCQALVSENDALFQRPDLVVARFSLPAERSLSPELRYMALVLRNSSGAKSNQVVLVNSAAALCVWEATSRCEARAVVLDGTVVITLASGHVFLVKLHHGARAVDLAQAGDMLANARTLESLRKTKPNI